MTKTKIVALLSVLVLLASLPMTVALAQEGPPYLVIGKAMVDGELAMMGTMVVAMVGEDKVGSGEVVDDEGLYSLKITGGNMGDTVMISLMMGEMEYMASTEGDVMIGVPGTSPEGMVDLMAYSGEPPEPPPTAAPTLTAAQEREAMRGLRGLQGPQGEAGADGADGVAGGDGAAGARGPAGAGGAAGAAGARGGADGSDGSDGSNGSAGSAGLPGADGATGPAGPAGSAGADGGGGVLAVVALIIAIVGVVAAGGAFIAGRQSS